MSDEKKKTLFLLAFSIVIAVWFFGGFGLRLLFGRESGTIGDTFGAVNAFFTGLALIGVIVAIYYQRSELEQTRGELKKQADIHDAHLKMLEEQNEERKRLLELEHAPALMLRQSKTQRIGMFLADLTNAGAQIHDLCIKSFGPDITSRCTLEFDTHLERGNTTQVCWIHRNPTERPPTIYEITVEYKNALHELEVVSLRIGYNMDVPALE